MSKFLVSKAQALAIFGGRAKLLPGKGERKPQPGQSDFFVSQDLNGQFFTEQGTPTPIDFSAMPSIQEMAKQQYKGWK